MSALSVTFIYTHTPSVRFNIHFPGEPGTGVYWSKGWWRWWWQLDYWSYKLCKAPVKSSPLTNQHPVFYRPDALPVSQPTVSKHWRESITFQGLAYPKLTWGLPTLSLTTNSSCYLGDGCHDSHQPSDASTPYNIHLHRYYESSKCLPPLVLTTHCQLVTPLLNCTCIWWHGLESPTQ